MAKKTLYSVLKQRSTRLEFVKKYRSLTVDKKGAGMINFSWINAQIILYSFFGGRSGSCLPGDKKT